MLKVPGLSVDRMQRNCSSAEIASCVAKSLPSLSQPRYLKQCQAVSTKDLFERRVETSKIRGGLPAVMAFEADEISSSDFVCNPDLSYVMWFRRSWIFLHHILDFACKDFSIGIAS